MYQKAPKTLVYAYLFEGFRQYPLSGLIIIIIIHYRYLLNRNIFQNMIWTGPFIYELSFVGFNKVLLGNRIFPNFH